MSILVSGGAGYIGSHTCVELIQAGYDIVVADNLVNSSREAIRRVEQIVGRQVPFVEAELCDPEQVEALFQSHPDIRAVIHFAGLKAVGESVEKPLEYYTNNLVNTLVLLNMMRKHGVKDFVFSSSATVYGNPGRVPFREDFPVGGTTNPYGTTKLFIEQILTDLCAADSSLNVALLRYFNPIGAHESGLIGEDPNGILYRPGGSREAGEAPCVRRRLSHAGRHRGAGLYPCGGLGPGPCLRAEEAGGEVRPVRLQSGDREGLLRAGGPARL